MPLACLGASDARSPARRSGAYDRGESAQRPPMDGSLPEKRLAAPHARRLERELLRGAQAAGFATGLWTCPRVARLIERHFSVHYHVDHIGRLFHFLGWSPQTPPRRAIEREEERIRQWIKQTWPALRKRPAG